MSKTCVLCLAKEDAFKKSPKLCNTILIESNYFIVVPCIGPLVAGQVMILSKEHYPSLASMGSNAMKDFLNLTDSMKKDFSFNDNVLITEHGSVEEQSGGACITHAHVHWIPTFGEHSDSLNNSLPEININGNLSELVGIKTPYILVVGSDEKAKAFEAYNAHSQMMRKAICTKVGRFDWDWAKDPQTKLIEDTIKMWRK